MTASDCVYILSLGLQIDTENYMSLTPPTTIVNSRIVGKRVFGSESGPELALW